MGWPYVSPRTFLRDAHTSEIEKPRHGIAPQYLKQLGLHKSAVVRLLRSLAATAPQVLLLQRAAAW